MPKSFIVPIYAYKCTACGHAQDVLQKISDKPLTVCPECHQETYAKQVTAAGFQLKGSGWYVTDFRQNGGGDKGSTKTSEATPAAAGDAAATSSASGSAEGTSKSSEAAGSARSSGSASTSTSAPAPTTPAAPASSPSKPASGGSAA